ncbi:hypothetical protein T12_3740 [Trichinella patagoniensis]|uniref:Uncharacterized protein n=1 Tax=Trichinella patagoniensis TaxID=990121 RepID=A0A0V0ZRI8_9BILA|nr:hypothetical protein T12_3740 [Trichinella patagoniensis]
MDVFKHVCESHQVEKKNCCQSSKELRIAEPSGTATRLAGRYGYTPGGVEWRQIRFAAPPPGIFTASSLRVLLFVQGGTVFSYWEILLLTTIPEKFQANKRHQWLFMC